MTDKPSEHPAAREEYLEAVTYYDDQRVGLGDELIRRLEDAIGDIADDPEAWPTVPDWEGDPVPRSHRVRVFPFRVIYYLGAQQIRVIAYAHTSREPGYWRGRFWEDVKRKSDD